MASFRRSRFTSAVVACVIGLGVCGVTLAMAGPSPTPPADPLATLPPGVVILNEVPCGDSRTATTLGGLPVPESPTSAQTRTATCWHTMMVQSVSLETANALTQRIALFYGARGFAMTDNAEVGGFGSFSGANAVCGSAMLINANPLALTVDPDSQLAAPTGVLTGGLPPGVSPPGAGRSTTTPSAPASSAVGPGPATAGPTTTVPRAAPGAGTEPRTTTTARGAPPPASTPGAPTTTVPPGAVALDPATGLPFDPFGNGFMPDGNTKGGAVVVQARRARTAVSDPARAHC